jgi:hypothetical protein
MEDRSWWIGRSEEEHHDRGSAAADEGGGEAKNLPLTDEPFAPALDRVFL